MMRQAVNNVIHALLLFLVHYQLVDCACPADPTTSADVWVDLSSANLSCYLASTNQDLSFIQAFQFCSGIGGKMVEIENQLENGLASGVAASVTNDKGMVWIGLNSLATEAVWEWGLSSTLATYLNWGLEQPQDFINGVDEDCAVIEFADQHRWHDVDCNTLTFPVLCEADPVF